MSGSVWRFVHEVVLTCLTTCSQDRRVFRLDLTFSQKRVVFPFWKQRLLLSDFILIGDASKGLLLLFQLSKTNFYRFVSGERGLLRHSRKGALLSKNLRNLFEHWLNVWRLCKETRRILITDFSFLNCLALGAAKLGRYSSGLWCALGSDLRLRLIWLSVLKTSWACVLLVFSWDLLQVDPTFLLIFHVILCRFISFNKVLSRGLLSRHLIK